MSRTEDAIKKSFETIETRQKSLNLTLLGQICTKMRLSARPVEIEYKKITKVATPLLLIENGEPIIIHSLRKDQAICGDGYNKLYQRPIIDFANESSKIAFVFIQRAHNTVKDNFNWAWVWSIVKNYKKQLILVIVVSLVAQLFALGTPLLLQQLIDKVLTQGNLSSLNSLAILMIVFALFNNVLTALRQFLFVDTTDRIDLTFGSSIINKMLQLKLGFFEARPIGELSQRIGEMNTIRGFLTGTAITTFLDLTFSTIYLGVMLSYSPGLTAVALSTFPIYAIITFVAAPIYRDLLRNRAKAQAAAGTQSKLLEEFKRSKLNMENCEHGGNGRLDINVLLNRDTDQQYLGRLHLKSVLS